MELTSNEIAVAEDRVEDLEIVYRWKPPRETRRVCDDCADEYAVTPVEDRHGRVMVWARYGQKWLANPWSVRPLLAHLIDKANAEAEPSAGSNE